MNKSVVALGFFDGVHLGHQKVIKTAVTLAKQKNSQPAVMTFTPHPKEVINKEKVNYLTTLETKKEIFENQGIEVLYLISFDADFAALSPREFAQSYLIDFQIEHVVAGYDFTYGLRGEGNMHTIVSDGDGQYKATKINKVLFQKEKISSTRIRTIIQDGNVDVLPNLLGDFYRTNGIIRAKELLKNETIVYEIEINEQCLLPIQGTYEVMIQTEEKTFQATIHRYCTTENVVYMTPSNPQLIIKENQTIKIKWVKCRSIKRKAASTAVI